MATTFVRWPHDVHILVTPELSKRLGSAVGKLLHVSAGDPFEMDADEAQSRLEAGDVMAVVKDKDAKPQSFDAPVTAKTEAVQPDKADSTSELHGTEA